jgi:hypothetical protein
MADASGAEPGLAGAVVRETAGVAERLAGRLDAGGLEAVGADLRSFARRRPGAFLLGAAAVGFVAVRVARNLSADGNSQAAAGFSSYGNGQSTDRFETARAPMPDVAREGLVP